MPLAAASVAVARRKRINWGDVAAYVILSVWMVFTLFPVVWLLVSSVKEPTQVFAMPPQWIFMPTLHNYEVALGLTIPTELETVTEATAGTAMSPFPKFLFNTFVVAIGTTVLALSLGSAAAYALTRFYPTAAGRHPDGRHGDPAGAADRADHPDLRPLAELRPAGHPRRADPGVPDVRPAVRDLDDARLPDGHPD